MRKIILSTIVFIVIIKNNVSAQYWSALGTGVDGTVVSLLINNGSLYAGGYFYSADGIPAYSIARWDGIQWSAVGTGFYDGGVNSLAVYNNEVYAAGWFYSAGDSLVNNIAKWNGTSWTAVGSGLSDIVYCLAVFNNELYAGGWFYSAGDSIVNNIAKWNGTNWSAVGTGLDGGVYAMAVYHNELYVTGNFWSGGDSVVNNIAKWNGVAWSPVGTGLDYTGYTLAVYNEELYVGGVFASAGGVEVNNIAKWNGTSWSATGNTMYSVVHSLAVYKGKLYAGAENWIYEGAIFKYDGTSWSLFEQTPGGTIYALAADDSALYVGGAFDYIDDPIPVNRIAKWTEYCHTSPLQPGNVHGNTIVCAGSIQTYTVDPVTFTGNYTWTIPSTWTGSSTTNSITLTVGQGGGTVSVFANNNCGSSVAQQIEVAIKPVPLQPDSINGNLFGVTGKPDVYFVRPVSDATSYTWTIDGGGKVTTGQGTNSVNVDWWAPGVYTISVLASNICGGSTFQHISIKVADISSEDPYEIKLYPNPSFGEFNLNSKRIQEKMIKVNIMNMLGQVVYKNESSLGSNNYTQQLDLRRLAPGMYVVRITIDGEVYTRKIVKK